MITKSEWQAAHDAMLAADRTRLGEPPTAEELLAYERGELRENDADRVRESLIAWPELAAAFAAPLPDDDAKPGDADDFGAEVVDRQWAAFSSRMPRRNGHVLQFWRGVSAIAATVAIVFGAMLWQQRAERLRPRVLPEPQILMPDGSRGGGEEGTRLTATGDTYLLVVSLIGSTDYEAYRVDIENPATHKVSWSSEPLHRGTRDTFNLEVPSRFLPPGTSRVVLYGLRGNAAEQAATYTVDVRRSAAGQ
jgi:hypothetical protein